MQIYVKFVARIGKLVELQFSVLLEKFDPSLNTTNKHTPSRNGQMHFLPGA